MAKIPSSSTSTFNGKVLVVDDEESVLKLVKAMLTKANYDVVTVTSAEKAIELVKVETFECVVTDAIMPEISGYEFVKSLRADPETETIPVVMLTRKRNRTDVKMAVEAGVTDYVLKPIDEHLLLEKVELSMKKGKARKHHVFECAVYGELAEAKALLPCRIIVMSESGMTVRLPIPVTEKLPLTIPTRIFEAIGIEQPWLKLVSCAQSHDHHEAKELPYEVKYAFVGVEETSLRKIRSWLQREEIRRKK